MIEVAEGLRVNASIHAAERALARVPELHGVHRDYASAWIERVAGAALRDGRKALRCPRWCIRDDLDGFKRRGRAKRDGTLRFVWDEDETVVCLVRKVRDDQGEKVWLVQTVITPR